VASAPPEIDASAIEDWLLEQPPDIAVSLASRSALRAAVTLFEPDVKSEIGLPDALLIVLRAVAISRLISLYPEDREMLHGPAQAAVEAAQPLVETFAEPTAANAVLAAVHAVNAAISFDESSGDFASQAVAASLEAVDPDAPARGAFLNALADDLNRMQNSLRAHDLAQLALWDRGRLYNVFSRTWDDLKAPLIVLKEDWEVWTDWYEDRLFGRPQMDDSLEFARVALPEDLWRRGPAAVNSEIRHLQELFEKDGPEMVHARMAELYEQTSEPFNPAFLTNPSSPSESATFSSSPDSPSQTAQSAFANVSEAAEKSSTFAQAPALPNVWLLQYNEGDRVSNWVGEAVPGSTLRWKTGKSLPKELQTGDPVVYWRTKQSGGIVGTGHILSRETELEDGILRLPTQVHEFFEDDLVPRNEAIGACGINRKNWRGAILDLPPDQAVRLNDLLLSKGRLPVFPEGQPSPGSRASTGSGTDNAAAAEQSTGTGTDGLDTETRFSPDDAETERDDLGRGVLAIALARRLHLIWCRLNNAMARDTTTSGQAVKDPQPEETEEETVFFDRSRQNTRAGFVLHLDAPWGGGKTTFANFLARVLNPTGYRHSTSSFLKKRYGDADISTVFLSDPLPGDGSGGTGDGRDWPEGARRPWIVVPFNAWQAQHVSPPWWVFYQTIRKRCFESVIYEGWASGPINGKPAGKPNWPKRQVLRLRLWGPELWWRLWNPKVITLLMTGVVSLCLLGILRWAGVIDILGTGDEAKAGLVVSDGLGFLLGGLTGISFLWGLGSLFTESIRPGTDTLAERMSLGSGDPFERFRRHFYRTMKRVKRPVLVIVDDLDRCSPDFIVDLVRGMQTLLRSPRVVFVVLGDRDWIERAFEVHHKDMNKVSVGPEQTFGARFVEKAIQMSFILPGLVTERQKDYVRHLLLGANADKQQDKARRISSDTTQNLRVFFQRAVKRSSAPVLDSEALKDRVRSEVESSMATSPSSTAADEEVARVISNPQAFDDWFKDEYTIHTASDEDAETEISHRLEPLADHLPANPRQIKRIINAVTMYNAVAFRERGWKPDDARWLQLARWVVVMTEWPKTWRLLASFPALADLLYASDAQKAFREMKQDDTRGPELPDTEAATLEEVERIRSDVKLMALLSGEDAKAGEKLDRNAISDLVTLTPLHSREVRPEGVSAGG